MSDKAVPDISSKLSAPKKISGFEKQRQEAEAKRLREEAENRAALRAFESSFADEDEDDDPIAQLAAGRGPYGGGGGGSSTEGYVRGAPMRNSGPGTLGPPAGLPPPSMKRKREFEQERERRDRHVRALDDRKSPEPAAKRPTMLLSSLPRNTTEATIRSLLPSSLKVDDMAFVPSPNKHSMVAIVALSPDTASSDIDSAVNLLQQRYLGFGFYLNISKHITISSHVSSVLHSATSASDVQPFGAKPMPREIPQHSFRNAPPPELAPFPVRHQGPAPMVINVAPPSDLKVLAMINKTVEKLIRYGPDWECLLMAQPEVQHGEHWAWLFDNTSPAHVWYRWLVWQYYSSQSSKTNLEPHQWGMLDELAKTNGYIRLFDDGPFWLPPVDKPRYDHVESLGDILDDSGYVSSDLDTDDEDDHIVQAQTITDDASNQKARYLNPYRKAKLAFFLNHLPDSTGYLCEGDVQAVTDLVIKFAGQGAEEVVDMLVTNLENPFRFSMDYSADRYRGDDDEDEDHSEGGDYDDELDGPRASFGMLGPEEPDIDDTAPKPEKLPEDKPMLDAPDAVPDTNTDENTSGKDISGAQLVGLYIISDALAATSVSGVRDAWKYRSLFESSLTSRNIFEKLGRMPKQHKWGRVRSEQWKSRIGVVLDCWEKESIFAPESHRRFRDIFLSPPLTGEEQKAKDEADAKEREEDMRRRWKSGDAMPAAEEPQKQPEQQQLPQPQPRQRSRPTAADLISATAEAGEAPPPKPAPKLSNFSISLNATSPPAGSPPALSDTKTAKSKGFSFGASGAPKVGLSISGPMEEKKVQEKGKVAGIFGDSDSE